MKANKNLFKTCSMAQIHLGVCRRLHCGPGTCMKLVSLSSSQMFDSKYMFRGQMHIMRVFLPSDEMFNILSPVYCPYLTASHVTLLILGKFQLPVVAINASELEWQFWQDHIDGIQYVTHYTTTLLILRMHVGRHPKTSLAWTPEGGPTTEADQQQHGREQYRETWRKLD